MKRTSSRTDVELGDVVHATRAEQVDQLAHEHLGRARAGGDAHHPSALQPLLLDLVRVVDQVGLGAAVAGDLHQAHELDELREPITSIRSHFAAICLTAAWRLVVA